MSDIITAIEWTVAHRKQYNARIINISASAPVLESFRTDPLCEAVRAAVEAGITVVASAGNAGRSTNDEGEDQKVWGGIGAPGNWELSRRLLKLSGGSVDDYATFSTSVTSPSC